MISNQAESSKIIEDEVGSIARREEAASCLEQNPSATGIEMLLAGMDDDDPAVRWATSNALAELGEVALPTVLQALIHGYNNCMGDSACHYLRGNGSLWVRRHADQVCQALCSVAPEVTVPLAASDLLKTIKNSRS